MITGTQKRIPDLPCDEKREVLPCLDCKQVLRCWQGSGIHARMETNHTHHLTVSALLTMSMQQRFSSVLGHEADGICVVEATNPQFGDYQCNAAMGLAKKIGKVPRALAEAVVAAGPLPTGIAKMEVAGPGFINITLDDTWLIENVRCLGLDPLAGVPQVGAGKTVILDYSSPNVAKPMHIGHIRSTIIGNAIDRLYRSLGYRVVADNHIGDWGTQFGILIMGYRHFLDRQQLQASPVEELERIYVASYEKARGDESWMDACRAELVKLQQGDAENLALWQQFIALSLAEFERVYKRLDVRFDLVRGESYYHDHLAGVIARLEEAGLAEESEGAQVVFLEEEGLPVCIVRKRDGGFNYATTDLATVFSREKEFAPDRIVYVTDERQQLHFKQFFTIARKLGCQSTLEHVWFGLMRLPDATFSTRQGNVIKLEALLDEAERRAYALVSEASPDMPEAERRAVARAVGIGAVKYADLSQNPQTLITFTWDKALALDGNSGPYLQYAFARIMSLLDKYATREGHPIAAETPLQLTDPRERALLVQILRFPDAVVRAAAAYRPSLIADYLYALSQTYSSFYQNVPCLKAESGVCESRVRLCAITAGVLQKGLGLLGIETPARI
jgi:arginyl-tRNA synthetase